MEVKVTGLQKSFDTGNELSTFVLAVPEITFYSGEVTYIVGHNGSGKTLTLKLLRGELAPNEGSVVIRIDGQDYLALDLDVAVVRQRTEENLCMDLSVQENVLLRLPLSSLTEKVFPKKYLRERILQCVNSGSILANKLEQQCAELSGGQKQLLAFLTAAAQKSFILCLDEFLSSTDHQTSKILREKTRQYAQKNNACILVVSHDLEVALEDADRIIVLKDGALVKIIDKQSSQWNKMDVLSMMHLA